MTVTEERSQQSRDSQNDAVPPLVTVITPTWRRYDLLLNRCIPYVQAQDWERVEHLVISDGPDGVLKEKLAPDSHTKPPGLWYLELSQHDDSPHWGHHARLMGLEYASGEFITYCDDDDALRPEHCRLLAEALMADQDLGFVYSRMASHHANESITEIGHGPPACGSVGTPMLMHRPEITQHGTWGPASAFEDWELVHRWIDAGVKYAAVDAVTSDVWPSVYHGH